jgi:hypothetical protein
MTENKYSIELVAGKECCTIVEKNIEVGKSQEFNT